MLVLELSSLKIVKTWDNVMVNDWWWSKIVSNNVRKSHDEMNEWMRTWRGHFDDCGWMIDVWKKYQNQIKNNRWGWPHKKSITNKHEWMVTNARMINYESIRELYSRVITLSSNFCFQFLSIPLILDFVATAHKGSANVA